MGISTFAHDCMSNTEGESGSREKRIESIDNTNNSDERAYTYIMVLL